MTLSSSREYIYLLIGDVILFATSLYLTLFLRHLELPQGELLYQHFLPFGIVVTFWIIVFFIAGLYEKHTLFFKTKLPETLFKAQVTNTFIAIIFFYFIPNFGIEPKTSLFLYVVISSVLIFLWRIYGVRFIISPEKINAILIGNGEEVTEIEKEVNGNSRYSFSFVSVTNPENLNEEELLKKIRNDIKNYDVSVIVIDLYNKRSDYVTSHLYDSLFKQLRFVDISKLYEEIFDRIPLSSLNHNWFLENVSFSSSVFYDVLKRVMDFFIATIIGIVSLVFYPLVFLAIKLDDEGDLFIIQDRIGKNNLPIKIIKFRTMTKNDAGDSNKPNQITRVGSFLRKSRIDELPQLWNVLKGELSLIGPRPELPILVNEYEKSIKYYKIRHLIKPGLSGWAQIKDTNAPRRVVDIEKTRRKLSYDIYYLKNQSLILDIKIALKTIKTLMSRSGV